jgi:hypothetical protein
MTRALWRRLHNLGYRRDVGPGRRNHSVKPVPRLKALDQYSGEWVAVKDGVVIAHSPSSREVVRQLQRLGPDAKDAVLQRAATSTEAIALGLG